MTDDPRKIVADTVREIAEWGLTWGHNGRPAREGLFDIADQIERLAPGGDLCCPLCEEATCDEDCPLTTYRAPEGQQG